ncbi:MAG: phospholipase D family protein [Bacillota bacterium]
MSLFNSFQTPLPKGISYAGPLRNSQFEFIYDLSYQQDGEMVYERQIFSKIKNLIEEAREFIVIDMFLFNDDYDRKDSFPQIARELTDALIRQKEQYPDLHIAFITDEINTFYGAYPSKYLEKLKENGVQVVITDAAVFRDPNPLYSGLWRLLRLDKIDTSGKGWLPNPFSSDSPKVTLRAYLRLLNLKANHRKVVITEKEALVTSFNPHDASAYHSNIAFCVQSEVIDYLLESENTVVRFSQSQPFNFRSRVDANGDARVQLITEGKIKEALIEEISTAGKGDKIKMAMFYLAEHEIIDELIKACERGVEVQIILDANKDAFGIEKNGVPNRPVAYKLLKDSKEKIKIRWYSTHGEQFHSKLTIFNKGSEVVLIGGSANLTRRNINDYNLETDLRVILTSSHPEARKVNAYFDRLWTNEGAEYTLDFNAYAEKSLVKRVLYEVQERTGLSSF